MPKTTKGHTITTDRQSLDPSAAAEAVPKVIGLVGGVASGKSTVAALFAQLGAEVIDADAIARDVLESADVRENMRRAWGPSVFDGEGRPDRARVADLVFRDPDKRRELNAWVHPAVRAEMRARLDRSLRGRAAPLIVIDAPLLLEADLEAWCDAIVFVDADPARRAERAAARGWLAEEVARRESAQAPLDEKRARADLVIQNNGSVEETLLQVKRLFRQWTTCSQSHKSRPEPSEGENHG